MASCQKNLCYVSWQLLSELDQMKHEQYAWISKARDRLIGGWDNSRARYRSWRQKVDSLIEDMAQKGDVDGANWLAQTLLRDTTLANPAEFELTIPTGHGSEVIHIRGCPDPPPATTTQQPPGLPGLDATEPQLPPTASTAAAEPPASATATKKRRTKSRAATHQPSGAPTEPVAEAQVGKHALRSRGERHKPAPPASRKKIQRRATSGPKKRGPGRPTRSEPPQEIDQEGPYHDWKVMDLREELRKRGQAPGNMRKAAILEALVQDDKNPAGRDTADASPPTPDGEATTSKATEEEIAKITGDASVDAVGDSPAGYAEPDNPIAIRPETANHDQAEEEGPSTDDGSQVVPDGPSTDNVLSEVSGNKQAVPETTDA